MTQEDMAREHLVRELCQLDPLELSTFCCEFGDRHNEMPPCPLDEFGDPLEDLGDASLPDMMAIAAHVLRYESFGDALSTVWAVIEDNRGQAPMVD